MVASCCAYNCKQRSSKDSDVTFHRFPFTRPDMLAKWIHALRWKNWKPTKNTVVCSLHFKPQCFKINNDRRYLHCNAVPTIFSFPAHLQRRSPVQRIRINREENISAETIATADHRRNPNDDDDIIKRPTGEEPNATAMYSRKLLAHDHNYMVRSPRTLAKQLIVLSDQLTLAKRSLVTVKRQLERRDRKIESQEKVIRDLRLRLYGICPADDVFV